RSALLFLSSFRLPHLHPKVHMPSTRQRVFRKRNLRNGALLAISEAAKLVNIPLAHDVARHIQQIAVAFKPSVLQAPKANDSSAQKLAKDVQGLLDTLNLAIQHLSQSGAGTHGQIVVELCELQSHLSETYTKLQDIQTSQYTTKLVSQAEIRDQILGLKEGLSQTIVDLTLRLLVIVLNFNAHRQLVIVRRLNNTARHHSDLVREHNALVRKHSALVRHQRTSNTRMRRLERNCKGLTHQTLADP
ncbi:unnamed protein product, partial [Rhizoctonia solani]